MNEKKELPISWDNAKLENITTVLGDGLHGTPIYSEYGDYFFINGNNLVEGKIQIKKNTQRVSRIEFEKYKKILNERTILVSINGTLGNTSFYNNENVILGKSACYFNLVNEINKHFIRYYLTSHKFINYANKNATGSTIKNVGLKAMRDLTIPIPPLAEQHRIVAKIEELFSILDKGIESLKAAKEQLKVYRQAVLKWAFEGKLTNKNVKDGELPEGWEIKTIGDLFIFKGGGTPSKEIKEYWDGDIYWCSVKDVKGNYLNKTIDKISDIGLKNSSSNLAFKDEVILITRISPGKTIISKVTTAINQDLKIIYPKWETNYLFIHYLFRNIERKIVNFSSGTTVLGINLNNLNEINVPIPPTISEQQQIVQEIESRLSVCDKIEETITNSLLQAESLRQSILKKAFEGKLVEQDPNDEPASILLEKIKAERENNKPKKVVKEKKLKPLKSKKETKQK